jgi:hypothetical protein
MMRWDRTTPPLHSLEIDGDSVTGVDAESSVRVTFGNGGEPGARETVPRTKTRAAHSATAGGIVATLDDEGVLAFARGDVPLGTLALASPEPVTTWRLAACGDESVVLTLGEWLVWIDTRSRKTIRRVRARAKVSALEIDSALVCVGCDDGWVQCFRTRSGEARASFAAHDGGVASIALGKTALFTSGTRGGLRAWERSALDVAARAVHPVTAISAAADLVAVGDRSGRVRVLDGEREAGGINIGDAPLHVRIARSGALLAVGKRVAMRAGPPWKIPRPFVLGSDATAATSDDGYLFAGNERGSVDVHDLETTSRVTRYTLSDASVSAICRLPGALLAVGTGVLDGRVFIVDVVEAKVVHRLELHGEGFGVTALACDPRGRILASGSDDATIALVDPVKGRLLARLRVNETPVALAFDASGRSLACAFADGKAAIVRFAPKGAAIDDAGLRGVARVAWGKEAVVGFEDGRVERLRPPAEARAES